MNHPTAGASGGPGETLRAFADTMIPGDGDFPPASQVGADLLMATRLDERGGDGEASGLVAALDQIAGGDFAALPDSARAAAVAALQESEPALFAWTRTVLYFSYYQQPAVVDAIRRMGYVYNDTPLPRGYRMLPFDPAPDGTAPLIAGRGSYRPTGAITRLDLGPLADTLETELGR